MISCGFLLQLQGMWPRIWQMVTPRAATNVSSSTAGRTWGYNFIKWCCHQLRSLELKSYQKSQRESQEQYFSSQETKCAFLVDRHFEDRVVTGFQMVSKRTSCRNMQMKITWLSRTPHIFPTKGEELHPKWKKKPNCCPVTFRHARRPLKNVLQTSCF